MPILALIGMIAILACIAITLGVTLGPLLVPVLILVSILFVVAYPAWIWYTGDKKLAGWVAAFETVSLINLAVIFAFFPLCLITVPLNVYVYERMREVAHPGTD